MRQTAVLSIENALNWSWGMAIRDLIGAMKAWRFVRIVRRLKHPIDDDLIDYFPVSLLQNVDNMNLIKNHKRKVACRMGGLVIDKKTAPKGRYDNELAQVGAVIATNQELYEIAARVNGNTHLIPNGVDCDLFRPNPHRPVRKFTVGFAGNITGMGGNYKGWQYYVQACMQLEADGSVGHIERLHGGIKGTHQEQVSHEDMIENFYWKIDALILPSKGEGCSNVTGEAMACGVPVLITKVGYHGEMLEDGVNALFIERDMTDIAEKVRMVRDDPELRKRLSENGRAFVLEHQNVHEVAKEYERVFKTIIQKE